MFFTRDGFELKVALFLCALFATFSFALSDYAFQPNTHTFQDVSPALRAITFVGPNSRLQAIENTAIVYNKDYLQVVNFSSDGKIKRLALSKLTENLQLVFNFEPCTESKHTVQYQRAIVLVGTHSQTDKQEASLLTYCEPSLQRAFENKPILRSLVDKAVAQSYGRYFKVEPYSGTLPADITLSLSDKNTRFPPPFWFHSYDEYRYLFKNISLSAVSATPYVVEIGKQRYLLYFFDFSQATTK